MATPVDKNIADVVERALQKNASSRFTSLQEMVTAMRKAVGVKAGEFMEVEITAADAHDLYARPVQGS